MILRRPLLFVFPTKIPIGRVGFLVRLILVSIMGAAGSHLVNLGMQTQSGAPDQFNPAGFSGAILLSAMLIAMGCAVVARARDFGIRPVSALMTFVIAPIAAQMAGGPVLAFLVHMAVLLALLIVPKRQRAVSTLLAHNDR